MTPSRLENDVSGSNISFVSNQSDQQLQDEKRRALSEYLRKLLSGEIKPSSEPVRFLSIAEQKALGIPTESTTTTITFPKHFRK